MILGFLITLYFQYDIYLPLVSLSLTFILKNTAYFLLLAAFSLIIFLPDFLSYPYLKYEFNDSHFSSIHSLLAKCIYIYIFINCNRGKNFIWIHNSPQFRNRLCYYFFTHHLSLLKSSHLLTVTSVDIVWKGNYKLFYVYATWFQSYLGNQLNMPDFFVVTDAFIC